MGTTPLRDVPHEAWNMERTEAVKRSASFKRYAAAIAVVLAIAALIGYLALG